MPSKLNFININAINSYTDIAAELSSLKQDLPNNNLDHFLLFNNAYSIVTSGIHKAAEIGYFNNPEFIEKFTICFSSYYFKAVNLTILSDPMLPIAWGMLNQAAVRRNTPNFIFLMMGANAHINHDLPLALNELVGMSKTDDLLQDVLKIDKILKDSGREIIGIFEEPNKILNFLKRNFIFVYYRPTIYTILYWRIKAWHNYREIKEHGLIASKYQNSSIKIAKRLSILARILS